MAGDGKAWASGLGIPEDIAERFETLARELGLSAGDLIGMMVARVAGVDADLRQVGLHGLASWRTREEAADAIVHTAVQALPTDVRPTSLMWPPGLPFPWTADECKAAVIGYEVRWRGTFDDFLTRLRGEWEMDDGYAFLRQR